MRTLTISDGLYRNFSLKVPLEPSGSGWRRSSCCQNARTGPADRRDLTGTGERRGKRTACADGALALIVGIS